jgi:hypothetical protein
MILSVNLVMECFLQNRISIFCPYMYFSICYGRTIILIFFEGMDFHVTNWLEMCVLIHNMVLYENLN